MTTPTTDAEWRALLAAERIREDTSVLLCERDTNGSVRLLGTWDPARPAGALVLVLRG